MNTSRKLGVHDRYHGGSRPVPAGPEHDSGQCWNCNSQLRPHYPSSYFCAPSCAAMWAEDQAKRLVSLKFKVTRAKGVTR